MTAGTDLRLRCELRLVPCFLIKQLVVESDSSRFLGSLFGTLLKNGLLVCPVKMICQKDSGCEEACGCGANMELLKFTEQ